MAAHLRARLADLRAADSVADVPFTYISNSSNDAQGIITVDLDGGQSFDLAANHRTIPKLSDGTVDWTRVTRVKILRVGVANVQ